MNQNNKPWPTDIRLKQDKRTLEVAFESGERFEFPAEFLRVLSPSAEVQGHTPDQKQTVPGKKNVQITGVEPVGNYAVRLIFDDMHSSGIYTWIYLHQLGTERESQWATYLQELADKGLSRE